MPTVGADHFARYTRQNRIKHAILTAYFRAYIDALKGVANAFHYIDAFAGPGVYAGSEAGSPLAAIQLLASQSKPASATFVESNPILADMLKATLAANEAVGKLFDAPLVENDEFSRCGERVFARPIYSKFGRVATFAFVDPCGVVGLRMQDLAKILKFPYGECLVFWNYDGLNRWIGGVSAGSHQQSKLDAFFGNPQIAIQAMKFGEGKSGEEKELFLRNLYTLAVREHAGAEFFLPFRFQSIGKERTSHYLIHLSRHPLAFKIMKDVMHKVGSPSSDAGVFEFIPPSDLGNQADMFTPNIDRARAEVLQELRGGQRLVRLFTEQWILRPHDFLVAQDYKKILLALEAEGALQVLDANTRLPRPREKRVRSGKVTLGPSNFVRISQT